MTNQIRNPNDERDFARILSLLVLSLGGSASCAWAAGNSLGLFFGGLFVVTFLTPAAVLGQANILFSAGGLAAVVGPVFIAWLVPVLQGADSAGQWAAVVLVLAMYALAIGGIALGLGGAKLPVVFAAAAAMVVGLLWLTWPVWLSQTLVAGGHGRIVQELVKLHPPLVINGILTNEPAWTERSLAYHLTDLNQDVSIQLPPSGWICAAAHGTLGLAFWLAAILKTSARPHTVSSNVPST